MVPLKPKIVAMENWKSTSQETYTQHVKIISKFHLSTDFKICTSI